jgi:hypothetical protein
MLTFNDKLMADDFRRSTRQHLEDEQVIASLVRVLSDPRGVSRGYVATLIELLKKELGDASRD